jgi:hypothetical protein
MPMFRRLLAMSVLLGFAALVTFLLLPQGPSSSPSEIEAATLPPLSGPVVLTLAGLDEGRFPGGAVEMDVGRLATLGQAEIETTTIWTEGRHRYAGVLLADVLRAFGLAGQQVTLEFRALNDYAIEFSASEVSDEAPLLAYLADGEPMPVRDKGPIWLIYPYDSSADYRTDTIYARSIWQLDRIVVLR